MWGFAWVLIPLAAILAGAWSEWLKFKEKQAKLGASAESLEAQFDKISGRLEEQNKALIQRIQNLEAIVTSVEWDNVTLAETQALPETKPAIELPTPEQENTDEAARIASRLRS